jgi:hypothetical protein
MLSPKNIKFRSVWILAIITVLLLSACASPTPMSGMERAAEAPAAAPPMESSSRQTVGNTAGEGNFSAETDTTVPQVERIVIKNASLTLVVQDPSKSMSVISQLADEMNGYVVSANMYMQELDSGAQAPRAAITIRVPAEELNLALERIKGESDQDPISESISSDDVTSDYVDLQSRLRNLESTEAQLTEIMGSATKTEDVLNVYNQLVSVREQIEVVKGRIKYYEESAALSAISVDLLADEAYQPLTIGGWQPQGVAKSAVQALINTLKFLANAVIWIVIFVAPVILVLYLIFFLPLSLVWRAWRRRRAKRKETVVESEKPQQG